MRKNHWTTLVMTSLISTTLAGCAVPGRFSREQYAQLDSDPFLLGGSDTAIASAPVAERSATKTTKQTEEPVEDRFAFVADEQCLSSPECESRSAPLKKHSEEALASFFEVPEEAEAPPKLMQTVAYADDEFSRFMTNEKSQVVHASAEFVDTGETTAEEVQQTAEQSGFWGFPGDRPADSGRITPARAAAGNTNPFFDGDTIQQPNPFEENSSVPAVAPPADVFGNDSQNANWPPGDFEFN